MRLMDIILHDPRFRNGGLATTKGHRTERSLPGMEFNKARVSSLGYRGLNRGYIRLMEKKMETGNYCMRKAWE